MVGNLTMGVAGVAASILSNSEALMVDGLFSLVGFFSAMVAIRVGRQSAAGADADRPFGYAMDEAVFTTFRSLSLLGLVVFAFTNAVAKIAAYAGGTTPAPVRFEVIGVYTFVICLICAGLWFNHHRSWKKTGEASDILKLEARAAAFDGAITGCAGVGFGIVFLLQGTSLAFIAPVGDSIIVVVLCLVASGTYWSDFKSSMGEVLGVSASQDVVASVHRVVTEVVTKHDVDLVDVAVLKAGRTFSTAVYVNPKAAISGLQVDAISTEIRTVLLKQFKQAEVLVIVSESGRESFKPV
ncbi:cation transporter [Ruegeria sp. Alg231-54]|uniref:cation transporter n=1 Tax=Ruegeria sp. Alg231-54 TaxID=1922221 RepID=UPI0021017606|nr:cation transporter [Ruegeria sp. Alg231-54]